MPWQGNGWNPTTITRYIGSLRTSTGVAIVETDCGEGFLKAISNPEGPHVLGCELVGSLLADWLGLPTLDFSIIHVAEEDEIPLATGGYAAVGPAFITRRITGVAWGGDTESLRGLQNIDDISRLVLFDTWVRNCDRYRPEPLRRNVDNVFCAIPPLSESRRPILMAIDHTHTFTCGSGLTRSIAHIEKIQDAMTYGEFPEFSSFRNLAVEAAVHQQLQAMNLEQAQEFIAFVPSLWLADQDVRIAWASYIARRAHFLSLQS